MAHLTLSMRCTKSNLVSSCVGNDDDDDDIGDSSGVLGVLVVDEEDEEIKLSQKLTAGCSAGGLAASGTSETGEFDVTPLLKFIIMS